jgi:hypothetical protein
MTFRKQSAEGKMIRQNKTHLSFARRRWTHHAADIGKLRVVIYPNAMMMSSILKFPALTGSVLSSADPSSEME